MISKIVCFLAVLISLYTPITEALPSRCLILSSLLREDRYSELKGNYRAAEFYIESGLKISLLDKPYAESSFYYKKLGVVKWHLGKVQEAQDSFNNALSYARLSARNEIFVFCQKALEIISLYQEAKKERLEGRIIESNRKFTEAILLAKTTSNGEFAGKCFRQLAVNYWEQSNFEEYMSACAEALRLSILSRNRKEAGICCNNIGLYYWKNSSLSRALFFIEEGLGLSRMEEANDNVSICLSNLAVLYYELGDFPNSFKAIKETIAMSDNEGDSIARSANLNNLGLLYKNEYLVHRKNEDALRSIEAFRLALAQGRAEEKIKILNNLSQIYSASGQHKKAFEMINECIRLLGKEKNPETVIPIRNSLGFHYLEIGAFSDAAKVFDDILASNLRNKVRRNLWESYLGRGECWLADKQFECAIDSFLSAIVEIDRIRNEISYDLQKVSYGRDKARVYERMAEALLRKYEKTNEKKDAMAIIKFITKTKGEALVESMAKSVENKSAYSRIWSDIKKRCFNNKLDSVLRGIYQINTAVFVHTLRAIKPNAGINLAERAINIEQIVEYSIRHRQNIIEYFFSGNTSLIVTIQNGKISVVRFVLEPEIFVKVKGYVAYLASQRLQVETAYNKAKFLYAQILAPYLDFDKHSVTNLIIIPAGCLNELPFETLVTGGTAKEPKYLIHNVNITYMPSISTALMLEKKQNSKIKMLYDFVAFGDPRPAKKNELINAEEKPGGKYHEKLDRLPRSREEVLSIGRRFEKRNRMVFTDASANEVNFRKMSGIPMKILHIACHSIVDYANPQYTRLVLAQDASKTFDGEVNVDEIYELEYPVSLVVLSSCQTARGISDNYEGTLGLIRAFFISGTQAVVSTLWRIDDKAALVFIQFLYRWLLTGCDLASAVRNTKISMMSTKYRHPAYWAAFILNGGIGVRI